MPKLLDVVRDFSKRGIDLRFPFLFELLPFPCWDSLGADGRLRKQEKDATVGLPQRAFLRLFAVSDTVLLHRPESLRRRGIAVPRNSLARYDRQHLRG